MHFKDQHVSYHVSWRHPDKFGQNAMPPSVFFLILCLGNPAVDFLSFNVEEAEFQVLKTILLSKVDIPGISGETWFAGEVERITYSNFLQDKAIHILTR